MNKKIEIYVATHKESKIPNYNIYIPLHVGAEGKQDLGYIKDNTGDNISAKNQNYCELTGAYWIMKNSTADIVGLVHYRRYFFKNFLSNKLNNVINEKDVLKILQKNDIIVPKKYKMDYTVKKHYSNLHYEKDLDECGRIIKEKFPDYEESFFKVMDSWNMYTCNMFISKKEIFNQYYEWLFEILFELESRVDISKYNDYNKRIFGFLSERLFNVWLEKNKASYKIKELYVFNTDKNIIKEIYENQLINFKGKINKWLKKV